MNTKIIYISGNEVFDMTEIRAAFEEVRNTLGLDKNTILFGVPVDCDSALTITPNQTATQNVVASEPEIAETEPEISQPENTIIDQPPQIQEEIIIATDEPETIVNPAKEEITEQEEAPIPILSVLAAKEPVVAEPAIEEEVAEEEVAEEIVQEQVDEPAADEIIDEPVTEEIVTEEAIEEEVVEMPEQDTETQTVSVDDIVDDEEPVAPMEKTLEQLLESMTPLREDHETNMAEEPAEDADDFPMDFDDATDATLAQLATEFAENQDKIPVSKKSETQGKIGKLKNILPFKKMKRDDNGLMGDLFGWAGIAANDEEFSIPGFFTTAAGKK